MRIFHLGLAFIIKRNNNQTGRAQFVFIVRVIDCKLYILWLDRTKKVENQQRVSRFVETNETSYADLLGIRIARLITTPELLFPIYIEVLLSTQYKDVFIIQKKQKYLLDNNDIVDRSVIANEKLNQEVISDDLLRFNKRVYILVNSLLRYEFLQTFHNISTTGYQKVSKTIY